MDSFEVAQRSSGAVRKLAGILVNDYDVALHEGGTYIKFGLQNSHIYSVRIYGFPFVVYMTIHKQYLNQCLQSGFYYYPFLYDDIFLTTLQGQFNDMDDLLETFIDLGIIAPGHNIKG